MPSFSTLKLRTEFDDVGYEIIDGKLYAGTWNSAKDLVWFGGKFWKFNGYDNRPDEIRSSGRVCVYVEAKCVEFYEDD